jgi:hypothetical protein
MQTRLPNYIYIGFPKSGSTWLAQLAANHPDCFMPKSKELFFFDRYYSRGLDWYTSHFASDIEYKVRLEITHDYIFSRLAAERIKRDIADIKLIVFVRNPVEKAFSSFLFAKRNGRINSSFEDAIRADTLVLDRYKYSQFIQVYQDIFGASLRLFFFDDLVANAVDFGHQVQSYLEIEPLQDYTYRTKVLPASKARSSIVSNLAKTIAEKMRDRGNEVLLSKLKSSSAINKILFKKFTDRSRPQMNEKWRNLLVNEFSHDIEELSRLSGRDLANWTKTT